MFHVPVLVQNGIPVERPLPATFRRWIPTQGWTLGVHSCIHRLLLAPLVVRSLRIGRSTGQVACSLFLLRPTIFALQGRGHVLRRAAVGCKSHRSPRLFPALRGLVAFLGR
eukprot:scaffold86_cov338-Pavlova_lutheri.AAC.119